MAKIDITSGSGSIGDIEPGWGITEDATPSIIGNPTGSTGQMSLSASYGVETEFVIDNDYTLHTEHGDVSGSIDVLRIFGKDIRGGVSLEGNTVLQRLNADRLAPPVWRGKGAVPPRLQFGVAAGQASNPWGIAVSSLGYVYVTSRATGKVLRFDATTGAFLGEWGSIGGGPGQFATGPLGITVNEADGGNVYVTDPGSTDVQVFSPTGVFVRQISVLNADSGDIAADSSGDVFIVNDFNQTVSKFSPTGTLLANLSNPYGAGYLPSAVAVDENDNVITTWTNIGPSGGVVAVYNNTLTGPPIYEFNDGYLLSPDPSANGIYSASPSSDGTFWAAPRWGNFIVRLDYEGNEMERFYPADTGSLDALGLYEIVDFGGVLYVLMAGNSRSPSSRWYGFTGNIVQVYDYRESSLSDAFRFYIDLVSPGMPLTFNATEDPVVAFPGWTGNVWKFLNDLCAAYAVEMVRDGVGVLVRDVGSTSLETEDVVAGATSMELQMVATGRSINVQNYNTTTGSGVVYDASVDGKVFRVSAGETVTETVKTNSYPIQVNQPTHTNNIDAAPGQYFVIAADNLPVPTDAWRDYGGSVSVSISDTVPGGLDITIVAPPQDIPSAAGPYSLGISDGATTHPVFSVTGSGVFTSPETVNLLTGADPTKAPQDVALDIDNVFIGNLQQAYDRGAWACSLAAGPQSSLNLSIPSHTTQGTGSIAGGLSVVNDCVYRADSATVGLEVTSIRYSPYTTTGDIDSVWSGYTTGDFDAAWSGSDTLDVKIRPLKNPQS